MRRAKSLRIGVHHANAVVWGPVYRTRLRTRGADERHPSLVRRDVPRERGRGREHAAAGLALVTAAALEPVPRSTTLHHLRRSRLRRLRSDRCGSRSTSARRSPREPPPRGEAAGDDAAARGGRGAAAVAPTRGLDLAAAERPARGPARALRTLPRARARQRRGVRGSAAAAPDAAADAAVERGRRYRVRRARHGVGHEPSTRGVHGRAALPGVLRRRRVRAARLHRRGEPRFLRCFFSIRARARPFAPLATPTRAAFSSRRAPPPPRPPRVFLASPRGSRAAFPCLLDAPRSSVDSSSARARTAAAAAGRPRRSRRARASTAACLKLLHAAPHHHHSTTRLGPRTPSSPSQKR
jgi:hypothetical protein